MTTYTLCKTVIETGHFNKADMLLKLDVFLLNNRISQEQYNELVVLINATE